MPHDSELLAEVGEWLAKARMDLEAADFELTADPPFTADMVFHAQQAAEKSLKGFLVWHGRSFGKTHNLEALGQQCRAIDPLLKDMIDPAVPLTEYAWKFRYPGDPEQPSVEEATEALGLARKLYEAVRARLPEGLGS